MIECYSLHPNVICPRRRAWSVLTLALVLGMLSSGCVRRTLTIRTVPEGGLVFLNDEEVGYSPVSIDFTWYGDYDVIVRKPGYQTLKTHLLVRQPWYQIPPIDFFAEVVWPGRIHDQHQAEFELQPESLPQVEDLIERARAMR
ncbi:MAG: PEGA domain-containing protein, partial [Planctomycetes bacterium]|nr:PEGA domain-containing protein [Planctomycetota bacterium]